MPKKTLLTKIRLGIVEITGLRGWITPERIGGFMSCSGCCTIARIGGTPGLSTGSTYNNIFMVNTNKVKNIFHKCPKYFNDQHQYTTIKNLII
jgi:hypothetical protein